MGIQHLLKADRSLAKEGGQESQFLIQELDNGFTMHSEDKIMAADIRLKGIWPETELPIVEGFRRFVAFEGDETRIIWLDMSGKGQYSAFRFEDLALEMLLSADFIDIYGAFMKPSRQLLPDKYELMPVFPNPFNASVTIPFAVPAKGDVRLAVYNIRGQQIFTWSLMQLSPGMHQLVWNAGDAASGIYFVKMKAEAFSQIQKMVLIK
jgi:hypothetical protein